MEEGYNKKPIEKPHVYHTNNDRREKLDKFLRFNKCNNNIITIYLDNFKSYNNTNRLWCLGVTMMYNNCGG